MLGMLNRVQATQKKAAQWRKPSPTAAIPQAIRQLRPEQSTSLEQYWKARNPRYQYARHIALMVQTLEGLEPGDCLILNLPPRGSKSETVTTFLEHHLGRVPTDEVMYISYSGSLAFQKSRRMRNEVRSGQAFKNAFPHVALARDAKKVSEWRLEQGGGLIASGVGGSLTGKGARIAVVDDPIKGRKAAESQVIRDGVIEFLKADVITRLEPDGILILTQTRWHTEDPSGWLQTLLESNDEQLEGFKLKRLVIPALCEDETSDVLQRQAGESYWPERWSTAKLERNKAVLGEYDFASLYQQRPFLHGGNIFTDSPARFALEDHTRAGWRITITCDLAASQKRTADYTVYQIWAHQGAGENRRARVLEVRRGQWGIERIAQVAKELQAKYGVIIAIESVAAQIAVVNFIQKLGVRLKLINPSRMGDKFARAQPAAAAWNADRIEVPLEARGWEGCTILEYLSEHALFTGTSTDKHDDLVDVTAYSWLEGEQQVLKPSTPGVTGGTAQTNIQGAR